MRTPINPQKALSFSGEVGSESGQRIGFENDCNDWLIIWILTMCRLVGVINVFSLLIGSNKTMANFVERCLTRAKRLFEVP